MEKIKNKYTLYINKEILKRKNGSGNEILIVNIGTIINNTIDKIIVINKK